jgi:uncharacterized membrane protein YeaQ/YmgE (transglycosylase-associated protein family)
MGFFSWILFGALAGWVASIITGRNQRMGCLANIIVGVIGAFLGGLAMDFLTHRDFGFGWNLTSFIVAVLGAIVLLAITGWWQRRR